MSSISSFLPRPKNLNSSRTGRASSSSALSSDSVLITSQLTGQERSLAKSTYNVPPYGERHLNDWKPTCQADFADGGAYPEIHIAQYPLDMGKPKDQGRQLVRKGDDSTLSVQMDSQGNIDYSGIIARQGHSDNRIVHSSYSALVPLRQTVQGASLDVSRPSETQVSETTAKTKEAFDRILNDKASSKSTSIAKSSGPTYIRYTSVNPIDSREKQRIIKMVDVQEDPLAPPKFKRSKVPAGPPSPPPPVLRSPPRKLTSKDQEDWYIPPSVSNWTNPRGFTIDIDKRVASDGRNLQEHVVNNDNKSKLAEALYMADRSAREEIRQRQSMQQKLAEKEAQARDEKLRELARRAREERRKVNVDRDDETRSTDRNGEWSRSRRSPTPERDQESMTAAERRRWEDREHRKKEAEKELRMSRMGAERRVKMLAREEGRDISEKVALGVAQPSKVSSESQFDSRLFNRPTGISGAISEDQVYDRSLFAAHEAVRSIYRPRLGTSNANEDEDEEISPDQLTKEERFNLKRGMQEREEGPVEFEKDDGSLNVTAPDSSYGLTGESSEKPSSKPPRKKSRWDKK